MPLAPDLDNLLYTLGTRSDTIGNCLGFTYQAVRAFLFDPREYDIFKARIKILNDDGQVDALWQANVERLDCFKTFPICWSTQARQYDGTSRDYRAGIMAHTPANKLNLVQPLALYGNIAQIQRANLSDDGPTQLLGAYLEDLAYLSLATGDSINSLERYWQGVVLREGTEEAWQSGFRALEKAIRLSDISVPVAVEVAYLDHSVFVGYHNGSWYVFNINDTALLDLPDTSFEAVRDALYKSFALHRSSGSEELRMTVYCREAILGQMLVHGETRMVYDERARGDAKLTNTWLGSLTPGLFDYAFERFVDISAPAHLQSILYQTLLYLSRQYALYHQGVKQGASKTWAPEIRRLMRESLCKIRTLFKSLNIDLVSDYIKSEWLPLIAEEPTPELLDLVTGFMRNYVNVPNNGGMTALHQAAHTGCERCVGILLSYRALVSAEDATGRLPLYHAVIGLHAHLLPLLMLQDMASVADAMGDTPLHALFAHTVPVAPGNEAMIEARMIAIATQLMRAGVDANKENKFRQTPAFLARLRGYPRLEAVLSGRATQRPRLGGPS